MPLTSTATAFQERETSASAERQDSAWVRTLTRSAEKPPEEEEAGEGEDGGGPWS